MSLKNENGNEKQITNMMSVGLFCFRVSIKDMGNCTNKIQNGDIFLFCSNWMCALPDENEHKKVTRDYNNQQSTYKTAKFSIYCNHHDHYDPHVIIVSA